MAFTVAGVIFIITFGIQLAYEDYFLAPELELDGHPVRINNSEIIPVVIVIYELILLLRIIPLNLNIYYRRSHWTI